MNGQDHYARAAAMLEACWDGAAENDRDWRLEALTHAVLALASTAQPERPSFRLRDGKRRIAGPVDLSKPPSLTARILELHRREPELSGREIARRLGCSAPPVTQTLRALREVRKMDNDEHRRPPNAMPGKDNPRAKLTDDAVRDIRTRGATGESTLVLAAEYGVTRHQIRRVLGGHVWKHVPAARG
jgi:hypothetical protein